jgi:poly(3-hydroxybutyrate) depolymerase
VIGTTSVRQHTVVVAIQTAVPGTAELTLKARQQIVARRRYQVAAGRSVLRLRAPARAHGRFALVIVVHGSDGQTASTRRIVRIR